MTPLERAQEQASKCKSALLPFFERLEIAGSIRRKKLDPHDIELVGNPLPRTLFELQAVLKKWGIEKGSAGGKYIRLVRNPFGTMPVDLFLASADNFGLIFLIRTGSADFSKRMMSTQANKRGLYCEGGYLRNGNDEKLRTPDEESVFRLLGCAWIEPERRIV